MFLFLFWGTRYLKVFTFHCLAHVQAMIRFIQFHCLETNQMQVDNLSTGACIQSVYNRIAKLNISNSVLNAEFNIFCVNLP